MSEENTDKVEVVVEEVKKEVVDTAKFSGVAVKPKIFVDLNEKINVDVEVVSDSSNGRVEFVVPKNNITKDDSGFFTFTPLHFEFSFPTYDQISMYRQRSTTSNGKIDENIFRSFLMVNHLKDWDMADENNNKVILDFEINGELSRDTLVSINRVPTIVWDTVLTIFQKEAKISGYSQNG